MASEEAIGKIIDIKKKCHQLLYQRRKIGCSGGEVLKHSTELLRTVEWTFLPIYLENRTSKVKMSRFPPDVKEV